MFCTRLSFEGCDFSNVFRIILFVFFEEIAVPLVIRGLKEFRAFTFIFTLRKQSSYRDVKVSRNSL